MLPQQAQQLPAEPARVDVFLDDERFIAPWRTVFSERLGRPSVPVETLLRLPYLKHRYQLGYETLCREVTNSLSRRRFCRIALTSPVPRPTTLIKLVRRSGPRTAEQLNAALLGKPAKDKLLRGRKLRIDTTVFEADIDCPTDADPLEHGVRKLGRLVRRIKAAGAAKRTRFRDRSRSAGRRPKEISRTPRRRTGQAMGEIDRLTGEIAAVTRATVRDVAAVERNARRALRERPSGRLTHLVAELAELAETMADTRRLLEQTAQRPAGIRSVPDRMVSLADPDARPIRKGKPQHPTRFGCTALVAEDVRGFVVDHLLHHGNPTDAPQLVPAVGRVTTLTGRPPDTVVAGRASAPRPTTWPWPNSA